MPERIFLTYTNATAVPYQGSVLGHHIVLNYIDANGAHHSLQGTPEHRFEHNFDKLKAFYDEEFRSDGTKNTDSPFQRLQVWPELIDSDASLNQPHTIIAEGDDLSPRWALIQDFANEVNSIGYEYRPISQNSNSFAGGALQRAGFLGPGNNFPERFNRQLVFDPASGEIRPVYVPGFEALLTNPINTETPMPFPLDLPAAPLPPTNPSIAPDRRGLLNKGFGNSESDLASTQEALSGRGNAQPASPPQDEGTPAWRLARLNGIPLSAMPIVSSSNRNVWATPFSDGITPRYPNLPASPPEAEGPIGLFSGKPMRFPFAPIFNTKAPSGPTGGPDRSTALDDLIWNFGRSPASPFDAAMPFGPNRRATTDGGDGAPALSAAPAAFALPISAPPDSQGPLSLSDAYLEYLKRLNANLSRASATDPSVPAAPLVPSDDADFSGGLLGRLMAVAGIDPQNPNQLAPPQDDELRAFYRDDPVRPWTLQRRRY